MLAHKLVVPCFILDLLLHYDVHHFLTQIAHKGLNSSDGLVTVKDYRHVLGAVRFGYLLGLLVGAKGLLV